MVKALIRFFLLVVLLMALGIGFLVFFPAGTTTQRFVLIKPGMSSRAIAHELERAGVVRNSYAFLAMHAFEARRTLKAGEYSFDHPASALEVYRRLARGDVFFHTVVIPEGFNIFDIGSALEANGVCTKEEFLKVARNDKAMIAEFDPQAPTLEGFLFPDTYHFSRAQSAHEMASTMIKRFRQEADALGLTQDFHHIVTMASIVEKETALPAERPLIAGVFENRLANHIGLATDPSVIYAALLAGRYQGVIHQSDLTYDSPYNTYRYAGLPPGPIANPGRESLKAAMHPATSDYLYFVANNNGGHNFARTIDEHNRNVAAYRHGLAK